MQRERLLAIAFGLGSALILVGLVSFSPATSASATPGHYAPTPDQYHYSESVAVQPDPVVLDDGTVLYPGQPVPEPQLLTPDDPLIGPELQGSLSVEFDDEFDPHMTDTTVVVTRDDSPVANATITVNGDTVGQTNSDGTLDVSLPTTWRVIVHATDDGASGGVGLIRG